MSPARLEERLQLNRRLNLVRRYQKADPDTAHFFEDVVEELEAALRMTEADYEPSTF